MTAAPAAKPPTWYTVVSVILLLWMLMGIAAFAMDRMMTPEAIAALPEGQRALYDARPAWIVIVYGIATISGLLGAIALLIKKAWAVPVLLVSFVTVCLQMGYTLFVMDAIGKLGAAMAVPFPLTICVIGAFAVWFAMSAKTKGWLS